MRELEASRSERGSGRNGCDDSARSSNEAAPIQNRGRCDRWSGRWRIYFRDFRQRRTGPQSPVVDEAGLIRSRGQIIKRPVSIINSDRARGCPVWCSRCQGSSFRMSTLTVSLSIELTRA